MKPRKKQPAITRQAILEAASEEFALRGYAATGIGAIVDRSGLTKGALFHHFADKRALALAWIDGVLSPAIEDEWISPMAGVDGLSALISVMRSRCSGFSATGATASLVAVAAETAQAEPVLAEHLDRLFQSWRGALASMLQRGQQAGWIHRSIRPATEAGILVSMFAGFSVLLRCPSGESMRRDFAASLEAYLETLRSQ